MSKTRDSFVARFGEADAVVMESAAAHHENGVNSERKGSDQFRWALAICIGYECFTRPAFHEWHGFTAAGDDIKAWAKEHGDLEHHDGDVDYISLLAGAYGEYVPGVAR